MTTELMKKIADAMSCDFIGETIFNLEEIDEMKRTARLAWRRYKASWLKSFTSNEMQNLIVLIVNLAKSWGDGNEKRFWVKILNEIYEDSSVSQTIFYNDIENAFKAVNKKIFVSNTGTRRFRESILFHAFAPQESLDAFTRLLWDFYRDDEVLGFDYQPNNPQHEQIAKYLCIKFGGNLEDDDIELEGKTYALRASIKYGFAQDLNRATMLIEKTIKCFDDIYINNRIHFNDYYSQCIFRTVERILLTENRKRGERKRIIKEQVITDLSKIDSSIYYQLGEDNRIQIVIPEIRGFEEFYEEVKLEFFAGDRKLNYEYRDCVVGRDLIRKRVKRVEIPFSSIVQEFKQVFDLSIKVYFDDVLVSDSKQRLYRSFMVFRKAKMREVKGDCPKGSYLLAFPIGANLQSMNCSLSGIGCSYMLSLLAEENGYIYYKDKYVFFNDNQTASHVLFDSKSISKLRFQKNAEEYLVFKKLKQIKLVFDSNTIADKIVLIHNQKDFYKLTNISELLETGIYLINLQELCWNQEGVNQIIVKDVSTEKTIEIIKYAIFKNLELRINRPFLFDEISSEIVLSKDDEVIIKQYCTNSSQKLVCDYAFGQFEIFLPSIRWKVDEGDWIRFATNDNFYINNDTFHNNSVIQIENYSDKKTILLCNDEEVEGKDNNRFLIGDCLLKNANKAKNKVRLKVDNELFDLFTIYNQESFLDVDPVILLEDGRLIVDFSECFIGESDSQFELQFSDDDESYEPIICGIKDIKISSFQDGNYYLDIYLLKTNLFTEEKAEMPIYSSDVILGNPEKSYFKNKRISLIKSRLEKGSIRFDNSVIEQIEYIKEENGHSVYKAVYRTHKMKAELVEFEKKGPTSLAMYFIVGDELMPANIDIKNKRLTRDAINDSDIVACSSCYYHEEEK